MTDVSDSFAVTNQNPFPDQKESQSSAIETAQSFLDQVAILRDSDQFKKAKKKNKVKILKKDNIMFEDQKSASISR